MNFIEIKIEKIDLENYNNITARMMSIYYVYILETISKNGKKSFYTGYTNDLLRRKNEHKKGRGAKYCRGKERIELKYFETFLERHEAMKREREIKSLTREEKLKLVKNFING